MSPSPSQSPRISHRAGSVHLQITRSEITRNSTKTGESTQDCYMWTLLSRTCAGRHGNSRTAARETLHVHDMWLAVEEGERSSAPHERKTSREMPIPLPHGTLCRPRVFFSSHLQASYPHISPRKRKGLADGQETSSAAAQRSRPQPATHRCRRPI